MINFPNILLKKEIVKGRCPHDGYIRGIGLDRKSTKNYILADPDYVDAIKLAFGRTVVLQERRMNLFLLIKYFMPELPPGDIIEFGSYKGGNAIFMAKLAEKFLPNTKVFALDTFDGMPEADAALDIHKKKDFCDVDFNELQQHIANCKLNNLVLVKGLFSETFPSLKTQNFSLAHIDCDIYESMKYSYNAIRNRMTNGGYIVFDDATAPTCIGATQAVEELVIQRDGLFSEQIFPHFVFRHFD